jgi:hypothetical protein
MFSGFQKESFSNRLKDTMFLLKNSLTVIGKDKDIIKPYIRMAIMSTILTSIVVWALVGILTKQRIFSGMFLILFVIFILNPFRYFYDVRQKACQSWIVYNTIVGKDISYKDAHNHTKGQKKQLRFVALIEILMAYLKSQQSRRKGFMGMIVSLFLKFLEEVWDLLSHYMIPAIVIENKSLKDAVPKLKTLKKNVPANLAGVFGIDFVGNVIGRILSPIYLLVLALSVWGGMFMTSTSPDTSVIVFGIQFSWVPVAIASYIILVLGGWLKKFVHSIKVIYFTIFYTSIMMPGKIKGSMKKELTHYLKMGK